MKHHFRYRTDIKEPSAYELGQKPKMYNNAIKRTIFFYYASLQSGRVPTLKQMYTKFFNSWHEENGTEEKDIFERDPKEGAKRAKVEKEKYITKGYETVQKFYAQNAKKKQAIIAVNHPYDVDINGIRIRGTFDLVREVISPDGQGRYIEVVSFQTSKKKPTGFFLDNDLYSTFMHYAFLATFKEFPDRFLQSYINLGEEIPIERDSNDYKRMMRVLDGFTKTVNIVEPYPRQSFECNSCPFMQQCTDLKF